MYLVSLTVFFGVQLLAVALLVVYDIWVGRKYGASATISGAMRTIGKRWPIVPFIVGYLAGSIVCGLAAHFWGDF